MSKTNYVIFFILLFFSLLSFVFLFYEPHNFQEVKSFEDVKLNSDTTYDFEQIDITYNKIIDYSASVSSNANREYENNRITEEQYHDILNYLEYALTDFRDYKDYKNNNNNEDLNKTLYSSLWYITRAYALYEYYPVINCINNSLTTVSKYKPYFYYLKKEDKDKSIYLKEKANAFQRNMDSSEEQPDEIKNKISDAKYFHNEAKKYRQIKRECEPFYNTINEDFLYQSKLFRIKIIGFGLLIGIVFFFGKILSIKRIIKTLRSSKKKVSNFGETLNLIFFPDKVSEETIKEILKLSSLTTTISALGTFIITLLNLKFFPLTLTTIICTVILLISILIGIVALNTESKTSSNKMRFLCYYLFIFGLIAFIVLIVEFLLIINLTAIFSSIKESIQTFIADSSAYNL